jgi:error-prone DNA polymerase
VRGIGEKLRERLEEARWGILDRTGASLTRPSATPESESGPYTSLWDFWRRTRIEREPIERLIRLGAFAFIGLHERDLLWQLGLFYHPLAGGPLGAQLPMALPVEQDQVALPEMTHEERIAADLAYTEGAIVSRGHLMDLAMSQLHEGMTPSHLLDRLRDGDKVTVAGFVAVRQAPETAKGFVFHTLEDHFGLMNIITKPHLVQRYKHIIENSSAIIVHGHIERDERAVNVVTERMEPLPLAGAPPAGAASHNW